MPDYYATFANVQADREDDTMGPEARGKRTVRLASNIVKSMVKEPDDVETNTKFLQDAKDATIAVFDYLWDTRGFVQSRRSVTAADIHFYGDPQILKLVGPIMGEYFTGGGSNRAGFIRLVGKQTSPKVQGNSRYAPPD